MSNFYDEPSISVPNQLRMAPITESVRLSYFLTRVSYKNPFFGHNSRSHSIQWMQRSHTNQDQLVDRVIRVLRRRHARRHGPKLICTLNFPHNHNDHLSSAHRKVDASMPRTMEGAYFTRGVMLRFSQTKQIIELNTAARLLLTAMILDHCNAQLDSGTEQQTRQVYRATQCCVDPPDQQKLQDV